MPLDHVDWKRLRDATPENPVPILVSACVLGLPTGWEGEGWPEAPVIELLGLPNVEAVPFCPEDGPLGTPRPFTTIHGGGGFDVLDGRARVVGTDGVDVTDGILAGARALTTLARERGVALAILMDVSDSCGTNVVYLGPPEDGVYQQGPGVAAALLARDGVPTISQRDPRSLARIRQALEPGWEPPQDLADFVDQEWFRGYFGEG